MLGLISELIAATSPIMPPSAVPGAPGASASQRSARSAVPTRDGFALSVANRYAADIGAQDRAAGNVRAGAALLQVADRGLQDIDALLAKMKALAEDAAATAALTTLSDGERAILNAEFDDLRAEIDRIAEDTEFDGIAVLKGTQLAFKVGTGGASADKITLSLAAATVAGLAPGLASDDLTSAAGAAQAQADVGSAIDALADIRASVRAASVGFQGAARNLASGNEILKNLRADLLAPPAARDSAQALARAAGKQLLAAGAPALAGRLGGAMRALLSSARLKPLERPQAPEQAASVGPVQEQTKPDPVPRQSTREGAGTAASSGDEAATERS